MLLEDIHDELDTYGTYDLDGHSYTIRRQFVPDEPDTVIALLEFPAGKSIHAMGPSGAAPVREKVGLQVIVRSPRNLAENARTMIELVHTRLERLKKTINGRRYSIMAMHTPALKEQDRNNRWKYETNYVVLKERG